MKDSDNDMEVTPVVLVFLVIGQNITIYNILHSQGYFT